MLTLGYQLYSSRNFPSLERTFEMISSHGYTEAEGYSALFEQPQAIDAIASALDASGLKMPTAHFGLDSIQSTPAQVIATCARLGIKTVVVPYLQEHERPSDAKGWSDFAKSLAEAGKPILDAGLGYAWHNHDFELADIGIAETPLDLLMQADDGIGLELDLAWVARGGAEPMDYVTRYGDRLVAAHLKDIAAPGTLEDEDGWADVGHGTMDWAGLMQALIAAKAPHFIVEHDNPSDDTRFAARSFESVQALAKGTQ